MGGRVAAVGGALRVTDDERRDNEARLAVQNGGYRVENCAVYWRDKLLTRADAGTFSVRHFWWGTDSRRVFACDKWVRAADAATFESLNFAFARDADNVYDRTGRAIPGADAGAIRVLDAGVSRDANGYPAGGGYAADSVTVFYAEHHAQTLRPPADPKTFRLLGGGYAGDGEYIYFGALNIRGADPGTFHVLSRRFARDGRHVYFCAKRISRADPDSFTVTGDFIDTAGDKNGRFDWQSFSIARTP